MGEWKINVVELQDFARLYSQALNFIISWAALPKPQGHLARP
jgi:hypothetical protein